MRQADHETITVRARTLTGKVPGIASDSAKRFADIVNGYLAFVPWDELKDKWLAIRLSDGGHDSTLYDSKLDAVTHQADEFLCVYFSFRNVAGGITPKDAEIYLEFNRKAYDAGFRLPDPDHKHGGPDLFMPTSTYDLLVRDFARKNYR
jgi:hypothetical protein